MSTILTYPYTGVATSTVTLANPEYDNSARLDIGLIFRESRHGQALTYKDSDWPNIRTRHYVFTTMTKTLVDSLKTFLSLTAGMRIKLTDHNSEDTTGYIVTGENEIITLKDDCSYDISFDYMEQPT